MFVKCQCVVLLICQLSADSRPNRDALLICWLFFFSFVGCQRPELLYGRASASHGFFFAATYRGQPKVECGVKPFLLWHRQRQSLNTGTKSKGMGLIISLIYLASDKRRQNNFIQFQKSTE